MRGVSLKENRLNHESLEGSLSWCLCEAQVNRVPALIRKDGRTAHLDDAQQEQREREPPHICKTNANHE